MRIDAAIYSDIFALMESIASGPPTSNQTQTDVDTVRRAITAVDGGTAEFQEGSGVRTALVRLAEGNSQFNSLSSLVNFVSHFSETRSWPERVFRDLYNRSVILQGIRDEQILTPKLAVETLLKLRSAIAAEQKSIRSDDGNIPDEYSLITLVKALGASGRLKKSEHAYVRFAGARNLFDRSEILQSIPDTALSSPQLLVAHLAGVRQEIVDEQRTTSPRWDNENYALGTLVQALRAGGQLVGNEQAYERFASARELYNRSEILQNTPTAMLSSPQLLVAYLAGVRQEIVDEQRAISPKWNNEGYALHTLVQALETGEQLAGNVQAYERFASVRDIYDRSEILQNTPAAVLSSPQLLVAHLAGVRQKIVDEQRAISPKRNDVSYALSTLAQALVAGGQLAGNEHACIRLAGARDLYDRSPTLQAIPNKVLADKKGIARYLLVHRDRIAIENLRAMGMMKSDEYTRPSVEDHYSISSIVQALRAAGRIDAKIHQAVTLKVLGPINYFLKRLEDIKPQMRRIIQKNIKRGVLNYVDKSVFTALDDPNHLLSDYYVRDIIKWGRWLLTDPDVALRSIYAGDEIAFMTLLAAGIYEINIQEGAIARLENAAALAADDAEAARRVAVEALSQINDSFVDASDVDEKTADFLKWTHRLVEWNADAFGDDDPQSNDGGQGGAGSHNGDKLLTGSDQVTFSASDVKSESFAGFLEAESTATLGAQHMLESEQTPMGLDVIITLRGECFFAPIAPRFSASTPTPIP
jgi:hypothetical protein